MFMVNKASCVLPLRHATYPQQQNHTLFVLFGCEASGFSSVPCLRQKNCALTENYSRLLGGNKRKCKVFPEPYGPYSGADLRFLRFSAKHHFYARKQLCFQRVLAIAIPSVCPSVCLSVTRVDQSKTVQDRITKSSPSAARKTLVSGTVKLFHKFERGHPKRGP